MRNKNYGDGSRRNEIVKILFICGCIPYRSLSYLPYQTEMIRRVTRKMEEEGVIKKVKVCDKKVLIYTDIRMIPAEILLNTDDAYIEYYKEIGITDRARLSSKNETNIKRVLSNADAMIFFEHCGSKSFLEKEKFESVTVEGLKEDTYYSLREFRNAYGNVDSHITKDINTSQRLLVNSRAAGVLLTKEGDIYPVYDILDRAIQWSKTGEMNFLSYIRRIGLEKGFDKKPDSCLILYENTTTLLPRILEWEKKKGKTTIINADLTYEHMYFIPEDEYGVSMAEMIYKKDVLKKLYGLFLTEKEMENARTADFRIDGYDSENGIYKCIFCVPDMVKLKYFYKNAKGKKEKGKYVIYCFDYQMPFIEKELSDDATIVKVIFEDVIYKIYGNS